MTSSQFLPISSRGYFISKYFAKWVFSDMSQGDFQNGDFSPQSSQSLGKLF